MKSHTHYLWFDTKRRQEINRFKRWRIDTFGFSIGGGGMAGGGSLDDFMRDLAEQNGGAFTPIN